MLLRPRKVDVGIPNVLMRGAFCWFGALTIAGAFLTTPSSWLQRYALAAAPIGFAVIAFASLLGTPFTEYWTRLGARQRDWTRPSFRRANVFTTMLWGAVFAAFAVSCFLAAALDTVAAQTIFDWLLPLALIMWAVHRTSVIWDVFVDDAMEERLGRDALWDVGHTPASNTPHNPHS